MMWRITLVFGLAIVYSVVRYVAFAPQNVANLPVLIVNKGLSMAAALCFAIAFWTQWRGRRSGEAGTPGAGWFRAGIFGVCAHVPMSLAILRPSYFKEFFAGERLSFNGELVFLFGALTVGGVYLLGRAQWAARQRWWLSVATMGVLFAHVLSMGVARGLHLNRAHAYLPPMWLLSLIGIALGLAFLLRSRPPADQPGRE